MRRDNLSSHSASPLSLCEITPDLVTDLKDQKYRRQSGLFVAEGARFLFKARDVQADVRGLILAPGLISRNLYQMSVETAGRLKIPIRKISNRRFSDLSSALEPSGIMLVATQRWDPLPRDLKANELWIGLEHLQTAGNFGTLMRSAEACGARGFILFDPSHERVDPYEPVTVRASMGSIFGLRMISTSHTSFRKWRLRSEISVVGATGGAATDFRSVSYRRSVLLMLGEERQGLSDCQRAACDLNVRIPMAAGVDSLNVAMAGTVLLYEAFGQRHPVKRSRP
jgi:TrmH family RNA methyltransferase